MGQSLSGLGGVQRFQSSSAVQRHGPQPTIRRGRTPVHALPRRQQVSCFRQPSFHMNVYEVTYLFLEHDIVTYINLAE